MHYLHILIEYIVHIVEKLGYVGIVIMMFLESSFFPFPSEIVMPPAGYLAAQGKMNIYIVLFCGILGSILGGLFNYYLALFFGRKILLKYGKYFGVTDEKFSRAEKFLKEHGHIGTFIGRLIPVIRQYISFPAGLIRMNIAKFSFYTGLGAGIWVLILTIIGYFVGNNKELVKSYSVHASVALIVICIIIVSIYIWRKKHVQRNNNSRSKEK